MIFKGLALKQIKGESPTLTKLSSFARHAGTQGTWSLKHLRHSGI